MTSYVLVYFYDYEGDLAIVGVFGNDKDADNFIEEESERFSAPLCKKHCLNGKITYGFELAQKYDISF